MKAIIVIILALTLSGCGSIGSTGLSDINRILDQVLPATFKGDAHLLHRNAYFRITIDAGNLHRGEKGWEYDWLKWDRSGFVSMGTVALGKVPTLTP